MVSIEFTESQTDPDVYLHIDSEDEKCHNIDNIQEEETNDLSTNIIYIHSIFAHQN